MISKISLFIFFITFFALFGCGSSDVEDFVDNYKDKKIVATNEDENITLTNDMQDMLNIHNKAREDVGIDSKYSWSDKIANDAMMYAQEIAKSGVWGHDPKNHDGYENGPYGENLYSSTKKPTLATAAKAWVDEKEYYHYATIGDASSCDEGEKCGHYTQIIWKDSSKVGCAISQYKTGERKDWYVVVCKYKTPGNYIGEYPY